jgi:hypothetical protein
MLTNIFTKTIRDRWRGITIGVVSLVLLLFMVMSIYRDIDISFYTDLPEAFRTIIGLPAGADVASLAISETLAAYGAWVLIGLAIAMGSASIASEEAKGTIGLLLGYSSVWQSRFCGAPRIFWRESWMSASRGWTLPH